MWLLADSINSNTCNFDVYVRQHAAEVPSAKNLAYDVIMKLVQPLINQGYHLYFDNFYTYITLVKDLFQLSNPSHWNHCRKYKGIPDSMKKGKERAK